MKTFKIGRDFDVPIKIDDKSTSVSHDHATITIDDNGQWRLMDNNSTNGTYIEDENGIWVRCSNVSISPSTWIRLGEKGVRGKYFRARRVLKPNDYKEDFIELAESYEALESNVSKFNSKKAALKFITPIFTLISFALSLSITDPMMVRLLIAAPGIILPFLQYFILNSQEKMIRRQQDMIKCPKCRRILSEHDINQCMCPVCKAF